MSAIANKNEIVLQEIYCEVLSGASQFLLGNNELFIKHLSVLDQGIINKKNLEYYNIAISNGIPSEAARLAEIKKFGEWIDADEAAVESNTFYLKNLLETKSNPHPLMDMKSINKDIDDVSKKIDELNNKKSNLMGITANLWAARRLNRYYIYYCLYKNKELTERALSDCNFEEFDEAEVSELIDKYNEKTSLLSIDNIRKICIADFFQGHFHMCADDAFKFYGLPTSRLTYYQIHLFSYGTYFKNILSGVTPPKDIIDDPDKLIDWHNRTKNLEKIKENAGGHKIAGIAGATDAQLEDGGEHLISKLTKGNQSKRGAALIGLLG